MSQGIRLRRSIQPKGILLRRRKQQNQSSCKKKSGAAPPSPAVPPRSDCRRGEPGRTSVSTSGPKRSPKGLFGPPKADETPRFADFASAWSVKGSKVGPPPAGSYISAAPHFSCAHTLQMGCSMSVPMIVAAAPNAAPQPKLRSSDHLDTEAGSSESDQVDSLQ